MSPDLSIDAPGRDALPVMLLGLGANVGDRAANLREGLLRLASDGAIRVEAVSGLWASAPLDADGGEFLNAAVRVRTALDPATVLDRIKAVESALGRTGSGGDPRPLDVDILYCGAQVREGDRLRLPHPRRLERAFVLAPLAEVCGDAADPQAMRPVAELARDRLPGLTNAARRVAGPEWYAPPVTGNRRAMDAGPAGQKGAIR
jgi:2-amino-4-hydroxy-6-hydroxymethyldihydropteridine diphosphokinase